MLGLTLEEVVGELLTDHVVKLLARLGGQAHQELVQLPRHVHQLGVKEGGGERNGRRLPSLQLVVLHQTKEDEVKKILTDLLLLTLSVPVPECDRT